MTILLVKEFLDLLFDKETILKVLAKTDTGKIGLMGHSLGGASSVALGRERKDIGAVIDLDGTMI